MMVLLRLAAGSYSFVFDAAESPRGGEGHPPPGGSPLAISAAAVSARFHAGQDGVPRRAAQAAGLPCAERARGAGQVPVAARRPVRVRAAVVRPEQGGEPALAPVGLREPGQGVARLEARLVAGPAPEGPPPAVLVAAWAGALRPGASAPRAGLRLAAAPPIAERHRVSPVRAGRSDHGLGRGHLADAAPQNARWPAAVAAGHARASPVRRAVASRRAAPRQQGQRRAAAPVPRQDRTAALRPVPA